MAVAPCLWHSNAQMFALRLWHGPTVAIAIGIETHAGIEWLGSTTPGAAAAAAIEIGIAFIEIASREKRQRMRDLSDEGLASIRSTMRFAARWASRKSAARPMHRSIAASV